MAASAAGTARVAKPVSAQTGTAAKYLIVACDGGGIRGLVTSLYDRGANREVIAPGALQVLRAEADFLRGNSRRLGGASTFNVNASPVNYLDQERAEVHTVERWLYDERDTADARQRCFVEDSDQTYVLKRQGQDWLIDEVRLENSKRGDCPPGT